MNLMAKKINLTVKQKKIYALLLLIILCLIIIIYWWYSSLYESTGDAYLNANIVEISPRVTGQVAQLYVVNNQFVRAGQSLFDIDPVPYQVAVQKAQAQLAMNQATLTDAQLTANRILPLVAKKVLPPTEGDTATANLQNAAAAVQLAKANLTQAQLNLGYTKIVAPTNGWVTNLSLRAGNVVPADQAVFIIVSNEEFWVDANFKETQLAKIHPGQFADVIFDTYPDKHFKGVVESVSSGSGSAFSLLPPQNATGNWVKVTQRVPVRIRIIDPDPNYPLRIGTTANVKINLKKDNGS